MADRPNLPKFLLVERGFPCYNTVDKMGADPDDPVILVNPSEVLPYMQSVPPGKPTTVTDICKAIAVKNKVKGYCSLTTGNFIMTIANAVEEIKPEGKRVSVP